MAWMIGLDEAGYGPNLGPLVIGATAWRVDDLAVTADLYQQLDSAVTREPDGERIALADSKQLYKPGGGLALLERGVLPAIEPASSWSRLVDLLSADPSGCRRQLPWHEGFDLELPVDAEAGETAELRSRLQECCGDGAVEPPIVRARLVFPAEFNELVDRYGTKGAALSHVTLGLLRCLRERTEGRAVCVLDKHGGRNRYAALLQHHFAEHWIETIEESRPLSRYAWGQAEERTEVSFRTGGEAFLPTALASMTAKYLRELSMHAFNAFWRTHLPGLRPTAGYPVDAKRFKAEIDPKRAALGIDDHLLWRTR
ncbi:MAG: hypothetical protein AAF589_03155 [Planctomycetota bacterium]